jgi:integrase
MKHTVKGSIFKRKNGKKFTWWARVRYADLETGKPQDRCQRAESKADAQEKRNKWIADIEKTAGRCIGSEHMTFADLCDYYEKRYVIPATYVEDRKVKGLRGDLATVKAQLAMLKEHFSQRRLRSITYGAIRDFREIRLETKTKHGKQRSIATVNRELALLRRMLNVARAESFIITENPFNNGDPLISAADEKKRQRILTRDEEKALLTACDAPKRGHLKPIVIAALDTGCRLGELLKLRWADVDLNARLINILAFNTKTAKPRTVAISARLLAELERLQTEAPHGDPRMRVFCFFDSVKRAFDGARTDAGLHDLRFHDLRHSHASRKIQLGIPLATVSNDLGHTQIQTTLRYVNNDAEAAYQSVAAIDRFNEQKSATETAFVN